MIDVPPRCGLPHARECVQSPPDNALNVSPQAGTVRRAAALFLRDFILDATAHFEKVGGCAEDSSANQQKKESKADFF
jgi:hypothetical protein